MDALQSSGIVSSSGRVVSPAATAVRAIEPPTPSQSQRDGQGERDSSESRREAAQDIAKSVQDAMRYLRQVLDPDMPDGLSEIERQTRERARARVEGPPPTVASATPGPTQTSREGKPQTGTIVNVVA